MPTNVKNAYNEYRDEFYSENEYDSRNDDNINLEIAGDTYLDFLCQLFGV